MTYEIRTYEKLTVGAEYKKSYIVDNFEIVDVKKGHCIKFHQSGKKSATYVLAEKRAFHTEFETVIAEATTGRVLYRFA